MFKLLFKFTASVCMLLLLAAIAVFVILVGQDTTRDYAESRAYQTLTCGQFVDDLSSGTPARATKAIELYTAPGRNSFIKHSYTPAQLESLPGLRPLVETCLKQRAYTLPQAVRVSIATNVAERASEVMRVLAAPNYATPTPAPNLAPEPISPTTVTVSETITTSATEAEVSPTHTKTKTKK
jgi:hypothetical protein